MKSTGTWFAQDKLPQEKETELVSKYTRNFSWPLVFEWIMGLMLYVGALVLSFNGTVPLFIGSTIMFLSYLLLFNSMHGAGHKHFSRNIKRNRWMDTVIGEVSANLIHISYNPFTKMHLEHHRNTNVRDLDPDFLPNFKFGMLNLFFIFSSIIRIVAAVPIIGKAIIKMLPKTVEHKWESRKKDGLLLYTDNRTRVTHIIILAFIFLGYGSYGFWLVFLPFTLHRYTLMIVFMWLPHRSRKSAKYENSRDQITPLLNRLSFMKGLDFHLEHHLYPSIPTSHLRKLHFEIRDDLDKNKGSYLGRFSGKPWIG